MSRKRGRLTVSFFLYFLLLAGLGFLVVIMQQRFRMPTTNTKASLEIPSLALFSSPTITYKMNDIVEVPLMLLLPATTSATTAVRASIDFSSDGVLEYVGYTVGSFFSGAIPPTLQSQFHSVSLEDKGSLSQQIISFTFSAACGLYNGQDICHIPTQSGTLATLKFQAKKVGNGRIGIIQPMSSITMVGKTATSPNFLTSGSFNSQYTFSIVPASAEFLTPVPTMVGISPMDTLPMLEFHLADASSTPTPTLGVREPIRLPYLPESTSDQLVTPPKVSQAITKNTSIVSLFFQMIVQTLNYIFGK